MVKYVYDLDKGTGRWEQIEQGQGEDSRIGKAYRRKNILEVCLFEEDESTALKAIFELMRKTYRKVWIKKQKMKQQYDKFCDLYYRVLGGRDE